MLSAPFFGAWLLASCFQPALAEVTLGTGTASLLGGDLTDPEDDVSDHGNYAAAGTEEAQRPDKGNWVTMTSSPNSPMDKAPHQRHAYQDWQNSPPCAIFLNHPEVRKWYLGFLDGGNGGPTETAPFSCAVELSNAVALTHFTITTYPDMPDRDPLKWSIQASETGKDGDWVDIYTCAATDRSETPFKEETRNTTFLITSFTSANMAKICSAEDVKKITSKLGPKRIEKPGFPVQTKTYKWFRFAAYSCFNENSLTYEDFNRPPGFALGQLELFGGQPQPGAAAAAAEAEVAAKAAAKAEAVAAAKAAKVEAVAAARTNATTATPRQPSSTAARKAILLTPKTRTTTKK